MFKDDQKAAKEVACLQSNDVIKQVHVLQARTIQLIVLD